MLLVDARFQWRYSMQSIPGGDAGRIFFYSMSRGDHSIMTGDSIKESMFLLDYSSSIQLLDYKIQSCYSIQEIYVCQYSIQVLITWCRESMRLLMVFNTRVDAFEGFSGQFANQFGYCNLLPPFFLLLCFLLTDSPFPTGIGIDADTPSVTGGADSSW